MANSQSEVQVEFILNLLRNGGKRKDIMSKFGKKWQKSSSRTFDRRLKRAEEAMGRELKEIKEKSEQLVAEEIEARKIDIMDAIERKSILTQIARGQLPLQKAMVVDRMVEYIEVVPDWMDRKNAIAELNKMDGDYAPTKVAQTTAAGDDIQPMNLSNLTDDELRTLTELQRKSGTGKTEL